MGLPRLAAFAEESDLRIDAAKVGDAEADVMAKRHVFSPLFGNAAVSVTPRSQSGSPSDSHNP